MDNQFEDSQREHDNFDDLPDHIRQEYIQANRMSNQDRRQRIKIWVQWKKYLAQIKVQRGQGSEAREKMAKDQNSGKFQQLIDKFLEKHFDTMYINHKKKSTMKEIMIDGIPVYFFAEPMASQGDPNWYPQKKYMETVIRCLNDSAHGLLESPTGTGKTVCMLSAVFSWVHYQRLNNHKKYRVIYCSKTHGQLNQIIKELKQKTCFRPTTLKIGSRNLYCTNRFVRQNAKHNQKPSINQQCSILINNYWNQVTQRVQEIKAEDTWHHPLKLCDKYHDRIDYIMKGILNGKFHNYIRQQTKDIQDWQEMCPYYKNLYLKEFTQFFIMPYDYLMQVALLPKYQDIIKDSIIIFDQAHNITDKARDGRSFELKSQSIEQFKKLLINIQRKWNQEDIKNINRQENQQELQMRKKFHAVKNEIEYFNRNLLYLAQFNLNKKTLESQNVISYYNSDMKLKADYSNLQYFAKNIQEHLYQLFVKRLTTLEQRKEFYTTKTLHLKQLTNILECKLNIFTSLLIPLKKRFNEFSYGIYGSFVKLLKRILSLVESNNSCLMHQNNQQDVFKNNQMYGFRLIYSCKYRQEKDQNNESRYPMASYQIRFKCLSASFTFKQIHNYGSRCMLFTSGTMQQMSSWGIQLGLQFYREHILENKHLINNRKQVGTHIFKTGMHGHVIDLDYDDLNSDPKKEKALQLILTQIFEIIKNVKNGILVFFTNKTMVVQAQKYLRLKFRNIYESIESHKTQFFEIESPQQTFEQLLDKFKKNSKKGAILYSYFNGRISQGIDFPDHHCRAVIAVSTPWPNSHDVNIREVKVHYEQLKKIGVLNSQIVSKRYWYQKILCKRGLFQGFGRVIRHFRDYGLLFCIGNKFKFNELPGWVDDKYYQCFFQWKLTQGEQLKYFHKNINRFFERNRKQLPSKDQINQYAERYRVQSNDDDNRCKFCHLRDKQKCQVMCQYYQCFKIAHIQCDVRKKDNFPQIDEVYYCSSDCQTKASRYHEHIFENQEPVQVNERQNELMVQRVVVENIQRIVEESNVKVEKAEKSEDKQSVKLNVETESKKQK